MTRVKEPIARPRIKARDSSFSSPVEDVGAQVELKGVTSVTFSWEPDISWISMPELFIATAVVGTGWNVESEWFVKVSNTEGVVEMVAFLRDLT